MTDITLILGGARSGKSRHAERLIADRAPPWAYVATAQALDAEMTARIAEHQCRRGGDWSTTEAPLDLTTALLDAEQSARPVLVDCLTLWLSNLMAAGRDIEQESAALAATLRAMATPVVLVSNEVGLGIVPDNALARRFRDLAGRLNQEVAALANNVVFVAAGLPLTLK
jgi:adenosylcobinamide kinase/adenosylcobinamide-phosphate guanylyltransferase